jgi:hypothetical protein
VALGHLNLPTLRVDGRILSFLERDTNLVPSYALRPDRSPSVWPTESSLSHRSSRAGTLEGLLVTSLLYDGQGLRGGRGMSLGGLEAGRGHAFVYIGAQIGHIGERARGRMAGGVVRCC